MIGYVSVGILTSDIDGAISEALPVIAGTLMTALLLGGAGAYVISRRIRARTHGLEPHQITELLDSREALLYAISEGVIAVDHDGRIVLANDAARSLLGLSAEDIGQLPEQASLPQRLTSCSAAMAPPAMSS
ncbi:PAS domain-containing protein [Nesterenkonia pannonica]|uniref:PAS domain-containing protein n=1 Tax=Nesterenkonia pannonica TaxID=1548602 RepID=UPI0021643BC7|nr:PAS domain-containing protein [Nesterenkonia pannonica]